MPQSLSKLYVHLIFSTRRREPVLIPSVRGPLHAYSATVLKNEDCPALRLAAPATTLISFPYLEESGVG
jgi:putative transposase